MNFDVLNEGISMKHFVYFDIVYSSFLVEEIMDEFGQGQLENPRDIFVVFVILCEELDFLIVFLNLIKTLH